MHQPLAKWAEKGCSLRGGGESETACVQQDLSRFLPWRQDVRRSRWDVKTGPGDGFEACFWSPLGSCGPTQWPTDRRLWVGDAMWAVVYVLGQELGFQWVFEPWPEMIQGVMRLGRPWVVVLCGQAKCRNVPSQGDGSYLGCWGS